MAERSTGFLKVNVEGLGRSELIVGLRAALGLYLHSMQEDIHLAWKIDSEDGHVRIVATRKLDQDESWTHNVVASGIGMLATFIEQWLEGGAFRIEYVHGHPERYLAYAFVRPL